MRDVRRAAVRLWVAMVLGAVVLLGSISALAAEPEWASVADEKLVFALTHDEGGELRETKIWLAVVDGQGYVRTSKTTRWGKNVAREPDIGLRIQDVDYPLHASFVEDEAARARVIQAFRDKYGGKDWWLQIFRGRSPRIIRLDARNAAGATGAPTEPPDAPSNVP